ncbi:MAG: hypothetical protein CL532_01110 [Aestuariivita sp.]|nr:hypothetical protein [Aestuariivita sp.]
MIDWKNLDGALLVRSFSSVEGDDRIYAWFGAERVHIYNADLIEVDVFSLELNTLDRHNGHHSIVSKAIEMHEDDNFIDAPYTDDIFYSHEWDTGEDLEAVNT